MQWSTCTIRANRRGRPYRHHPLGATDTLFVRFWVTHRLYRDVANTSILISSAATTDGLLGHCRIDEFFPLPSWLPRMPGLGGEPSPLGAIGGLHRLHPTSLGTRASQLRHD